MRAVVQRVSCSRVVVEGEAVGSIDHGLTVLVGVVKDDGKDDLEWMARKLVGLRIFPDAEGRMNRSVADVRGQLLMVSQFTVCAEVNKGTRPSFANAMAPEEANALFEELVAEVGKTVPTQTGRFRTHMEVSLTNDGPVTIWLDSKQRGRG
jgi:D-tyrosyl-tRNA(Tyr) deacylase